MERNYLNSLIFVEIFFILYLIFLLLIHAFKINMEISTDIYETWFSCL